MQKEDSLENRLNNLPSLSVIIVTLNCAGVLEKCLKCIERQVYPWDLMEILIIDGGSSDKTLEIAGRYNAKIINAGYRDNQEARRAVGLLSAKNEILVYIDSDNFLPGGNWLLEMVEPFCEDKGIIATQTLRYAYIPTENLMSRYAALFGSKDPIPFYFKKQDRLTWMDDNWNFSGKLIAESPHYYTVEFGEDMPTLGCNGFLIRREILLQANHEPDYFFHTDVLMDLAKKGYRRYGIVKNSIIHSIDGGFWINLKKRFDYMLKLNQIVSSRRRFMIYDAKKPADNIKLALFIFYTLTLILPLFYSFKGYSKIKDKAWFLYLPMCWAVLFIYSFAVIKSLLLGRNSSLKTPETADEKI
jgi:glycosyltransferase involved in cell wall biosynthesis